MNSVGNWIYRHRIWLGIFGGFPWFLALLLVVFNPHYMSRFVSGANSGLGIKLMMFALGIQMGTILLVFPLSVKWKNKFVLFIIRLLAKSLAFIGLFYVLFIILLGPASLQMIEQRESPPGR